MNYELAKELKDAGFSQKGADGSFYVGADGSFYVGANRNTPFVPTLSEIIGACGGDFWSLVRAINGKWFCCGTQDDEELSTAHHSTPEEAVARLWLLLNK